MSDVRKELVSSLNRAIEDDYALIEHMLLKSIHTAMTPDKKGRFTGKVNALLMMCDLMNIEPIYAVYEDEIIQGFE